jgi:hypothetical protein
MIRLKNSSEFLVDLSVPGGQVATNGKRTFLIPFACTLKALYAKLGTAGTTGTQVNDIHKNGTSIFSGAVKVDFATTVTAATYGALTTDPTTFAKGDVITVDVDSVHSTPGENLNLLLVFSRKQSPPAAMETDTIGNDAE